MATSGFVRACDLDELKETGKMRVTENGQGLALFWHEDSVRCVALRCPHMGFPLSDGTVEDGVLTCHWHHARFELSCGDTFDPWADDVQTYPTEVRDGDVYVNPDPPRDGDPVAHWRARLRTGLEENLRLVVAKSVIGLRDADVEPTAIVDRGVHFGTNYREDGWSSGLTILGAMTNVLPELDEDDEKRALYTGLRHVASDCAGEPPHFDQPAFETRDVPAERLESWFRENVEVRDQDGAERVLRTAVAAAADDDADCTREDVERMLYAAATDHAYLDSGHTFDMTNKAVETLDHLGWTDGDGVAVDAVGSGGNAVADGDGDANAADTLASLVTRFTDANRSEENSEWRQPIDLAAMRENFTDDLPALAAGDRGDWQAPDDFQEMLLGDDPHEIVDALRDAIRDGATVHALAHEVATAAAARVAQFGTTNEFGDWNTVHHTFTYANAVQQAADRVEPTELYRGVLDGALSVYLDRFLNSPPATIPEPEPEETDDAEHHRKALLEAFEREGAVADAATHAAALVTIEHHTDDDDSAANDAEPFWQTLGHALLREDAGFHTLQAYEAAHAQFQSATDPDRERIAAIAAARYLAAHTPTRREAEQTYTIASRLLRGETIHE